jgi:ribonuclease-3 family protein
MVKTVLVSRDNKQAHKYHKEASRLVKAESQADYIDMLEDKLTENELSIYKRGRNTKTHSTAKNASVGQYRKATGFEAMIGYLYLNKEYDRLFEIVKLCLDFMDMQA